MVIVPTRSNFCEGMPATAAEAVLTGRPVLTSRLSNALDVLDGVVVESQPDDLDSYIEGLECRDDRRRLLSAVLRGLPRGPRLQFYDRDRGFGAALERRLAFRISGQKQR